MIARGIIPLENDLDIICLPDTWDRARRFGTLSHLKTEGVYIISIEDGAITLDAVVTYKKIAARPNDATHLDLIGQYLASGGN